MKMTKSQIDCFEDVVYQLELNLQNIRRELIRLLEEYRVEECFACNRLRCLCPEEDSCHSTTLSLVSSDSAYNEQISMDAYYNAAPPPEDLPTPIWPGNPTRNEHGSTDDSPISVTSLNIWIKASLPDVAQSTSNVSFPVPGKVLDHVNYSWPPFPDSIWSAEKLKETTERENMLSNERDRDGNDSVEAFFRHFGRNRAVPKTAFAC
ncbi:unnamed protein product [Chrysodeixis includens]|uniref:Uncharacterized protein n=1 Tax=Chrysodeixis includens TaxID=689277 RepID=A0A9N8L045_CHRIL|nr:unnamed protein product [Chrysodeixis includens]